MRKKLKIKIDDKNTLVKVPLHLKDIKSHLLGIKNYRKILPLIRSIQDIRNSEAFFDRENFSRGLRNIVDVPTEFYNCMHS